jgi:septal ring factor EnvC (AmiA/AmiB activator)
LPEPVTVGSSLQGALEVITAGVLSGLAGWFAKHFKDRNKVSGDLPRVVVRQIAEIHSALLVPDPELKLNSVEQTRAVFRFMTEVDADGVRVSWLRTMLKSVDTSTRSVATSNANIAAALGTLAQGISRMDDRLEDLEETWGAEHPDRPRRRRPKET